MQNHRAGTMNASLLGMREHLCIHSPPNPETSVPPGDQKWRERVLGDFETKEQNWGGMGKKDLPARPRVLPARSSPACSWAAEEDSTLRTGRAESQVWAEGGQVARVPSRTSPAALSSTPQP